MLPRGIAGLPTLSPALASSKGKVFPASDRDQQSTRALHGHVVDWASLENFASQRIAVGEKFYRDNDRLLEGGIWAEVVIAHNDIDADAYAFYVEDLRPIQLIRFDFAAYGEAKKAFTRNEWIDVVLRSVGLEPERHCHVDE